MLPWEPPSPEAVCLSLPEPLVLVAWPLPGCLGSRLGGHGRQGNDVEGRLLRSYCVGLIHSICLSSETVIVSHQSLKYDTKRNTIEEVPLSDGGAGCAMFC